jgi:hypothetical protein
LLIACANVASLLLALATSRRHELALRAALGASPSRSRAPVAGGEFVLALAVGALGVMSAFTGIRLVAASSFLDFPVQEIQIAWRTLTFTLVVSILTGVLFGLVPTFQACKPDLPANLRESGRGAPGSMKRQRVRTLPAIGQVGVSMLLLIAVSLLIRSFIEIMRVSLPATKYGTNSQKSIFLRQGDRNDPGHFRRAIRQRRARLALGGSRPAPVQ